MAKTRIAWLLAVLAIILILPLSAKAVMVKANDSTYIPKDEVVSSSLFVAGSSIVIDGKVQGDVFCAGQNITINGTVDGDVICAGQSITINGNVGGSVRIAGNSLVIAGKVSRNVMAAGANLNIAPQATIGWDLQFGSAFTDIRGKINRDVDGAGANALIAGNIGRNVYLALDDNRQKNNQEATPTLTIAKEAVINGNLTYEAKTEAKIESGSTIKGSVEKKDLKWQTKKIDKKAGATAWLWGKIISIFAALVIGLILVSWLPKVVEGINEKMMEKKLASLGWGFVILILTPIAFIILMITMIGIPLGLIIFGLWLLIMYPAKILASIALGRKITDKCKLLKRYHGSLMASMVFGVIICWLIFSIPVVGWFLCFLAIIWGIGGIWRYGKAKSQK